MAAMIESLRTPSVLDDSDDDIIELGSEPVRARPSRRDSDLANILRPSRAPRSAAIRRQQRALAARIARSNAANIARSYSGSPPTGESFLNPRSESHRLGQNSSAEPQIIDLTADDPPSVVQQSPPHFREFSAHLEGSLPPTQTSSATTSSRNPRRTNSLRASPPSLARSDSHTFGFSSNHTFIDLTEEEPEIESEEGNANRASLDRRRLRRHHHRRSALRHHHAQTQGYDVSHHRHDPGHHQGSDRESADVLVDADVDNLTPYRGLGQFAQRLGLNINFQGLTDILGLSRNFQRPSRANARRNVIDAMEGTFGPPDPRFTIPHPTPSPPKPPMEPVPPATEGFTRDTVAEPEPGEELLVVCPACNEELAYDPMEVASTAENSNSSPGKKKKRVVGEHHFWALKKCGHVYCADCFSTRRPNKTNPSGAGFRTSHGMRGTVEQSNVELNDLRCVVEGCKSKVVPKGEWIGIFL